VRNILVVNERRRPIAESDTAAFLVSLSRLRIRIDRDPVEGVVLGLALNHRLSVYDAFYLRWRSGRAHFLQHLMPIFKRQRPAQA
jgi:predicted nucleic acid-binding protein